MLHRSLHRRTFLKVVGQLVAMAASLRIRPTHAVQHPQVVAKALGYGVGTYNEGEYPGYKMYLPLIDQETSKRSTAFSELPPLRRRLT